MRKIVVIDQDKCIGCGKCVEACPTSALMLEDGKAKLAFEERCDGFGSCIAVCQSNAIRLELRDAKPFDWKILREIEFEKFLEKLEKHWKPV